MSTKDQLIIRLAAIEAISTMSNQMEPKSTEELLVAIEELAKAIMRVREELF